MDFSLTEEQQMLQDSVARFLEKNYSHELRRDMVANRQAMSEEVWQGFASLGLLGVPFSDEYGGFGGGGVETMLVMQQLGRHLVLEPYLSTVILAGGLVDLGAADWQRNILLKGIVDGAMLLAFAHAEQGARYDQDDHDNDVPLHDRGRNGRRQRCKRIAGEHFLSSPLTLEF